MRRFLEMLVSALVLGMIVASPSAGAAEPEWHSETPVAPGIGVPAPLGEVGDIEFWAPNRGVLITAGNNGMPAGVYAYDGTGWHLYSTVCGGHEGSIAWAGPDEFWTVSDYAIHQEGVEKARDEQAHTLCHFKNGEVVASYAEPVGTTTTYRKMEAAACDGPADCWFAGQPLPASAANQGPFHLHWDGAGLTAVPSPTEAQPQIQDAPGTITDLAFFDGALFESASEAPFLREVNLGQAGVFSEVPLPTGVTGPFALAGDGGQLWAVSESEPVALRSIGLGFEAIPLERAIVKASEITVPLAAEPNGAAVWTAGSLFQSGEGLSTLTRISASGEESPPLTLPRPEEGLNPKGPPTALACPSAGQCWLATSKGWLFHLGGPLEQDTDPAMHALITFRPSDNSTRVLVPPGLPENDSGESEATKRTGEEKLEPFLEERLPRKIVYDVHQKILGKRVLELSFKLRARAHVQLRAKYHGKVVAKTRRFTMGKGAHKIHLKLDPKRWPTGLDFKVHAIAKQKK